MLRALCWVETVQPRERLFEENNWALVTYLLAGGLGEGGGGGMFSMGEGACSAWACWDRWRRSLPAQKSICQHMHRGAGRTRAFWGFVHKKRTAQDSTAQLKANLLHPPQPQSPCPQPTNPAALSSYMPPGVLADCSWEGHEDEDDEVQGLALDEGVARGVATLALELSL